MFGNNQTAIATATAGDILLPSPPIIPSFAETRSSVLLSHFDTRRFVLDCSRSARPERNNRPLPFRNHGGEVWSGAPDVSGYPGNRYNSGDFPHLLGKRLSRRKYLGEDHSGPIHGDGLFTGGSARS